MAESKIGQLKRHLSEWEESERAAIERQRYHEQEASKYRDRKRNARRHMAKLENQIAALEEKEIEDA